MSERSSDRGTALLVLEDGYVLRGRSYGVTGRTWGRSSSTPG